MTGCTDDMTALYFSSRSGDMSIRVDSTSTTRQTMAVAQLIAQYRQTEGQGRRKLLTPDEVLRLPNEELLCVIRGCNVLKLKKLDYTLHARELKNCSIMDYHPAQPSVPIPKPEREPAPPDPDKKKAKPGLYSSAKPPTDF